MPARAFRFDPGRGHHFTGTAIGFLFYPLRCDVSPPVALADCPFTVKTRDNGVVPIVPRGLVDQSKIRAGVQRAERALAPAVLRIMYNFASDVMGEYSLFFRIMIADRIAAPNHLRENTQRIMARVLREIKADDLGLQTYFNFRSESEQALLRDSFWERS
jgi:hypothetical protein